jgi:ABC-type polysaccharide/polyol phosphate export permease
MLGSLNVYFRDTQHLVGVGLSALFFLSPGMYDLSFVERLGGDVAPWVMNVYLLNPLAGLFTAYRWAFLPGTVWPDNPFIWIGLAWPVLFLLLSAGVFRRLQRNFADYV